MKDDPEAKDSGQSYKLRSLASVLYPLITSVKGNALSIKMIIDADEVLMKQELVEQMLERIITVADELEEIRSQLTD